VRPQVVQALRQACQVENDPALVSGYIYFLALHTVHDSLPDLADLVLVSWLLGKLRQYFPANILSTTGSMSGHVMKMRTWCFGVGWCICQESENRVLLQTQRQIF